MIDASEASHHRPATFIEQEVAKRMGQRVAQDPFQKITGMPPGGGQPVIPHAMSFQGLWGTHSKVYLASDEALRNSAENARFMRNDCGIMECVEARQRITALLDWVIEPEDSNSQEQKELCTELTRIVNKIRRFTEYRMSLMHAVWFGRYGIQHTYGWSWIGGKRRVMPKPLTRDAMGWLPIHGDKLVFRYDDGNRMSQDYHPDQLGIRCTYKTFAENSPFYDKDQIETTGTGLAYFLSEHQRQRVAVHKHMIEDAAHDDGVNAGTIHGVGIRSRIYWDWFQKQEALAFLMEYLERSAGGIEVWTYPSGDDIALSKAKEAAKERLANGRNVVFFPKPPGEDGHLYDIQVIEPGMAGIEALKDILQTYFGHRIKRYILGQTLSSEAQATGLGSGLAELHLDTLLQIVKYDSANLEETITNELITHLKNWNFPKARGIDVHFRLLTERANVDEKLEGMQKAYEMGARLSEADVMEAVGARIPDEDDYVLQNPEIAAAKAQQEQMAQQQAMAAQGGNPTSVAMGGHGLPAAPNGAPSEEETTEAVLQAYYGDQDGEGGEPGSVVYANEGGKWEKREIPAGDTGDRRRADQYSKFNEEDHPRDEQGRFVKANNIEMVIEDIRERLRPKLAAAGLSHKLGDAMDGIIDVLEDAQDDYEHVKQSEANRYLSKIYSDADLDEIADDLAASGGSSGTKADKYRRENAPLAERIESAAAATERNPSEAQRDAGNYQKGKFWAHGLEFAIENPEGSVRSGKDKGGKEWSVEMANHYGYVKRNEGADGDQVDAFIGSSLESDIVTVIDQYDRGTGKFDEHKCFVFFPSRKAAERAYKANWSDGKPPKFRSRVLTVAQFREWLASGNLSKPIQNQSIEDKGE
jgi:hypothetical protein